MPADRADGRRTRVALVLGSGGARGLAHIGVIEEVERAGLEIVSIAGSSTSTMSATRSRMISRVMAPGCLTAMPSAMVVPPAWTG